MTAVQHQNIDVHRLITDLCARNAAAELHVELTDDDCVAARVRLLAVEDNAVLADRPQNLDRTVQLRAGQRVCVYVRCGNDRWAFDSRVIKSVRLVRLNARQRVVGMSLEMPTEVRDQQRRHDYRINVAGQGIGCRVQREDAGHPFACRTGEVSHLGAVVDLSARGLAVVLDTPAYRQFAYADRVFCELELPGCSRPMVLLYQVRHVRAVPGKDGGVMGLALRSMPGAPIETVARYLTRFVADEQRRKLRRRR